MRYINTITITITILYSTMILLYFECQRDLCLYTAFKAQQSATFSALMSDSYALIDCKIISGYLHFGIGLSCACNLVFTTSRGVTAKETKHSLALDLENC